MTKSDAASVARGVTVAIFKIEGTTPAIKGSGVWLGHSKYVATCAHVVRDISPDQLSVGIVDEPYSNTAGGNNVRVSEVGSLLSAKVVAINYKSDVAILELETSPAESFNKAKVFGPKSDLPVYRTPESGVQIRKDFLNDVEDVLAVGYPLGERRIIFTKGSSSGLRFIDPNLGQDGLRIVLSMTANHGNSGGPLLDGEGKLVGLMSSIELTSVEDQVCLQPVLGRDGKQVITNGIPQFRTVPCIQNAGLSAAVPAKFIAELAAKHNLKID